MGLDTVELVLAIEDEFGIRISDRIAQTLRTPGDVADYVMTRVRTEANSLCLAQAGFYRVRAALHSSPAPAPRSGRARRYSHQSSESHQNSEDSTFVDELGAGQDYAGLCTISQYTTSSAAKAGKPSAVQIFS
jgi:hypothetical protein